MLCRLAHMRQASFLHGVVLDASPSVDDRLISPEVDVGGRDVGEALVVAAVVVVIDERANFTFEITGQEVVFEQNTVLERLMPTLDLALSLWVVWRTSDMVHTVIFKPVSQVAGDVRRAVVAEQPRFVNDIGAVAS